MRQPTLLETIRAAMADPAIVAQAETALALFHSWAPRNRPRIPGIDTGLRLAVYLHAGRTVEEAAARELVYRWHLAIDNLAIHADGTRPAFALAYAPDLLGT